MYKNSLSDPPVRLIAKRFYGMGLSQGKPLGAAQSNAWGVGTSIGISTLYARRMNDSRRCHAHTHKFVSFPGVESIHDLTTLSGRY